MQPETPPSSSGSSEDLADRTTPSSSLVQRTFDIAIVGSGIVGSALAYSFAKSGRSVVLVERDVTKPDRIVGELLQPGGVRALKLLGIEDALEGIDAVPVEGYEVFYGPRKVPIPYPEETAEYEGRGIESTSGKVEGRSFHHGNFVQSLRRKAKGMQSVTFLEATVRDLKTDSKGRIVGVEATRKLSPPSVSPSQEEDITLSASVTIVCDGCFSKFRRSFGSSIPPRVRSNFVALELTHAPLPSPHFGHVVLAPSGPILLYQISSEHTRILIDVAGEKLPSIGKGDLQKHIYDNVIPHLPGELGATVKEEMDKGQRLRSMPNSFLPPSMQGQRKDRQGVIVVGDAMNMRHPLTGGGMSVGLWDAVHLTNALGGGKWAPIPENAPKDGPVDLLNWQKDVRPALKAWHWQRKGLSSVINVLAQALYSLFGADDENLEVLREGCFKYFELGGECVGAPVRLLSGLAPRPLLLSYHFFSVALYSIYLLFTNERKFKDGSKRKPTLLDWPALMWRSVMVFYTAVVVFVPVVATEFRSNIPRFSSRANAGASGSNSASSKRSMTDLTASLQDRTTLLIVSAAAVLAWIYVGHGNGLMQGLTGIGNQAKATGGFGRQTLAAAAAGGSKARINDWFTFPKAAAQA